MTVAIYGPQSLADLSKLAHRYFNIAAIKNNVNASSPEANFSKVNNPPLFLPEQLGTTIAVETTQKTVSLDVRFQVPVRSDGLNTQLYAYLTTLLESQAEGSLNHQLKIEGLASGILVYSQGNRHFGLFDIYIDLTVKGSSQKNEVLLRLFQYLHFLKVNWHPLFLQAELKSLERINNEALVTMEPGDWLSNISDAMQTSAERHWIDTHHWDKAIRQEEIKSYLEYFKPAKAQVIISSDKKLKTFKVTPHYNAKYQVLPTMELNSFTISKQNDNFAFPTENSYLPLFTPLYIDAIDSQEKIIESSACLNMYALTKHSKGSAKIFTVIDINSGMSGIKVLALQEMLSNYLATPNTVVASHAEIAGYSSLSSVNEFGIRLILAGDYSGFGTFLDSVIKNRLIEKPTKEIFKQLKVQTLISYEDKISVQSYKKVYRKISRQITGLDYRPESIIDAINGTSYQEYNE